MTRTSTEPSEISGTGSSRQEKSDSLKSPAGRAASRHCLLVFIVSGTSGDPKPGILELYPGRRELRRAGTEGRRPAVDHQRFARGAQRAGREKQSGLRHIFNG